MNQFVSFTQRDQLEEQIISLRKTKTAVYLLVPISSQCNNGKCEHLCPQSTKQTCEKALHTTLSVVSRLSVTSLAHKHRTKKSYVSALNEQVIRPE